MKVFGKLLLTLSAAMGGASAFVAKSGGCVGRATASPSILEKMKGPVAGGSDASSSSTARASTYSPVYSGTRTRDRYAYDTTPYYNNGYGGHGRGFYDGVPWDNRYGRNNYGRNYGRNYYGPEGRYGLNYHEYFAEPFEETSAMAAFESREPWARRTEGKYPFDTRVTSSGSSAARNYRNRYYSSYPYGNRRLSPYYDNGSYGNYGSYDGYGSYGSYGSYGRRNNYYPYENRRLSPYYDSGRYNYGSRDYRQYSPYYETNRRDWRGNGYYDNFAHWGERTSAMDAFNGLGHRDGWTTRGNGGYGSNGYNRNGYYPWESRRNWYDNRNGYNGNWSRDRYYDNRNTYGRYGSANNRYHSRQLMPLSM